MKYSERREFEHLSYFAWCHIFIVSNKEPPFDPSWWKRAEKLSEAEKASLLEKEVKHYDRIVCDGSSIMALFDLSGREAQANLGVVLRLGVEFTLRCPLCQIKKEEASS